MICPFCGQHEPATNEHVFGKQFARRFPSVARHIETVGDYAEPWAHADVVRRGRVFLTRYVTRGSREPELHQVQVKVGSDCNNRWMSKLDDAAVDVLDKLTAGAGLDRPSQGEAEALAMWFTKMGLAYDLYQTPAERAYSDSIRHDFFATRDVPAGTIVYLGHEPSQRDWVSFWQHGWYLGSWEASPEDIVNAEPNLSTTFMAILGVRLVAHRISPELETWQQEQIQTWVRERMAANSMVPLTSASLFRWPLPSMDGAMLEGSWSAVRDFVSARSVSLAPDESAPGGA